MIKRCNSRITNSINKDTMAEQLIQQKTIKSCCSRTYVNTCDKDKILHLLTRSKPKGNPNLNLNNRVIGFAIKVVHFGE